MTLDARRLSFAEVAERPLSASGLLVHFLTIDLITLLGQPLHQGVGMFSDLVELPWPVDDIKERPEIMTIVIRILRYCEPLRASSHGFYLRMHSYERLA